MPDVHLTRFREVDEFLVRAGAFLAAREAEHNLIFGICTALQRTPQFFEEAPYLVAAEQAGTVVAAALRTPPHNLVLSIIDDGELVDLIAEDALAVNPDLPGVLGPTDAARRFAQRFTQRTGRSHRVAVAERIFRLRRVVPPRRANGAWRVAEQRDRDVLAGWLTAFVREALGPDEDTSQSGAYADRWIARQGRTMYFWEDDGRPVCMVGAGGETPSGIRIGPVYTPPEARGRGYASNLTAAVSQAQLDVGHRFCFLFTDLANQTSNKIYQQIGYEPVIDVDQYRFEPRSERVHT